MATPRKTLIGFAGALLVLAPLLPSANASAEPSPPFIPIDAPWLTTVNYFRQMSGQAPVSENPTLSAGAYQHSCYMLQNDITHYEQPGKPGYTAAGELAGRSGNVAVSSVSGTRARSHIELWMTGPFHAMGVLRRNLATVGFGKCDDPSTPRWRSGATLDILNGLGPRTSSPQPIVFPGNGATTSLDRFVVETPDPIELCGWPTRSSSETPYGLPVFAMMPVAVGSGVTTSLTGPSGPITTCTLSQYNTSGSASQILAFDNAIVAVPSVQLLPGTYTATAGSSTRTVSWSFTVDPAAATGVITPAPTASPTGPAVGFQAVAPARVVDTRDGFGATRLQAGVQKRIQVSGRGGIPDGATAVSANFTVVSPDGAGFLTVWDCAATPPVASTVNFSQGETAPNAATTPLDANGGLCVSANVGLDLVIDVNGYYGAAGAGRYTPVAPTRLMDTREGLGGADRLEAGEFATLQVTGLAGIPSGVQAVSLNVTSVDPGRTGYVTAYACDTERPLVSNLNPQPGRVRPNLVVVPVSGDGQVCLFSQSPVELVVDVTGYFSTTSTNRFTSTTPFRMVDTRDLLRNEMNRGTGGLQLGARQVIEIKIAGDRGVPVDAKAVSLNLTATNGAAPGFVTAWPCGDRPHVSTANYGIGDAVSNGAQLPLSAAGTLCIYALTPVHVVVDVNGWWS